MNRIMKSLLSVDRRDYGRERDREDDRRDGRDRRDDRRKDDRDKRDVRVRDDKRESGRKDGPREPPRERDGDGKEKDTKPPELGHDRDSTRRPDEKHLPPHTESDPKASGSREGTLQLGARSGWHVNGIIKPS